MSFEATIDCDMDQGTRKSIDVARSSPDAGTLILGDPAQGRLKMYALIGGVVQERVSTIGRKAE